MGTTAAISTLCAMKGPIHLAPDNNNADAPIEVIMSEINMRDQENKEEKRIGRIAFAVTLLIGLVWVSPCVLFLVIFNNPYIVTGMAGYVRTMILRALILVPGGFCLLASLGYYRLPRKNEDSNEKHPLAKKVILAILAIVLFALSSFLLAKGFRDIPYLHAPKTTVLSELSFIDSKTDRYNSIDSIDGHDETGKLRFFKISRSMLREAKKTLPLNYNDDVTDDRLKARISYLPNTRVLMGLEYVR